MDGGPVGVGVLGGPVIKSIAKLDDDEDDVDMDCFFGGTCILCVQKNVIT